VGHDLLERRSKPRTAVMRLHSVAVGDSVRPRPGEDILTVPCEIEDPLLQLGMIEEGCVFKISDKEIGNRICPAVVLRTHASANRRGKRGISDALNSRIIPLRFPHDTFFEELPKNAEGKTQRSEVIHKALTSEV
jgi:acyl-coenzyme A synthetase/AMP-(fatty) acid ligase